MTAWGAMGDKSWIGSLDTRIAFKATPVLAQCSGQWILYHFRETSNLA
jgi:hypothetical protein